jgi:hypothetical protein
VPPHRSKNGEGQKAEGKDQKDGKEAKTVKNEDLTPNCRKQFTTSQEKHILDKCMA